jgi:glucuronosyltransferase
MYTAETTSIWMRWKLGLLNTDHVLSNAAVQNLIEDNSKKFDLVISDHSSQEAMYLFAYKFKCPLITIGN